MDHVLLVIWINPFIVLIGSLSLLDFLMLNHIFSEVSLHFSIVKNLISSYFFQLHSVEFILVFFLKAHHALFSQLLFSLKVNLVDLVLFKSFKVIWFNSVVSKHTHFCLWVFSHEIGVVCFFYLEFLLSLPSVVHSFIIV